MAMACSPRHSDHEWRAVVQELSLLKEEVDRLREDIGDLKLHFKQARHLMLKGLFLNYVKQRGKSGRFLRGLAQA